MSQKKKAWRNQKILYSLEMLNVSFFWLEIKWYWSWNVCIKIHIFIYWSAEFNVLKSWASWIGRQCKNCAHCNGSCFETPNTSSFGTRGEMSSCRWFKHKFTSKGIFLVFCFQNQYLLTDFLFAPCCPMCWHVCICMLKVAVRRIIAGKWGLNNGQACISPDHIITTKDFAPQLVSFTLSMILPISNFSVYLQCS